MPVRGQECKYSEIINLFPLISGDINCPLRGGRCWFVAVAELLSCKCFMQVCKFTVVLIEYDCLMIGRCSGDTTSARSPKGTSGQQDFGEAAHSEVSNPSQELLTISEFTTMCNCTPCCTPEAVPYNSIHCSSVLSYCSRECFFYIHLYRSL